MDRMAHVLQQLKMLYDKQERSRIDIDLMLDYTRVLYADLLEHQNEMPTTAVTPLVIAEHKQEAVEVSTSESVPMSESVPTQASESPEDPGQALSEPEVLVSSLEKNERTGISFEPPTKAYPAAEKTSSAWVEESPEAQVAPIDIPLTVETPEQSAPAAIQGFTLPKDIRKSIGINDKYLFLNELFNNHKSNYEETLDRLSNLDTYQQAEEWLWAKIGKDNHWEREDATVMDFFSMLQKFFASR